MSKLDNKIINNLKMLSLDMINTAKCGDASLVFTASKVFECLFMKHLIFDISNPKFINRDRVVVSNRLLPLMYASNYLFTGIYSLDDLKEFKKLSGKMNGYAIFNHADFAATSTLPGDVIPESIGISLGCHYLEELVRIEDKKCDLINFKTFCICTMEDLLAGASYEAMSFLSSFNLKNTIFIVLDDNLSKDSDTSDYLKEDLTDRFMALNFDIAKINDNYGSIDGAIEDALYSKKPSVIVIDAESIDGKFNKAISGDDLESLRNELKIASPFMEDEELKKDIREELDKRLKKTILKWQNLRKECLEDLKLKEIIFFLETGKLKLDFKSENIKINDSYEEELIKSNHKILNIIASKSPFVLCGSNDNFLNTLGNITKSDVMSKENPTGRNILFGPRPLCMAGVSLGLASLGFKVFVSTPLIYASLIKPFIVNSVISKVSVNFIFTQSSFLDTYDDYGFSSYDELTHLRNIPNLLNFRPADINEVLGTYEIVCSESSPCTIIIGSKNVSKLSGTNPKYVLAGAYRVKKEEGECNAIILATGEEVPYALEIQKNLAPYGIDFRVVSMPSKELFKVQSEKYRHILLPKSVKTFTLEFQDTLSLREFATNEDYAFGLTKYNLSGTKEELKHYHNLNLDYIEAKILELMKN